MADTFKHAIKSFSGGILEDKRAQSPNHFSITKNFDCFKYPSQLIPYAQTLLSLGLSGASVKALNIVKFLYAPFSSTLNRLFGYGVDGSGFSKIYIFDIDAGTPNTSNWVALSNGASGVARNDTNVFFYYKGFIYMYRGGTTVIKADATGSGAFNDNYQTITYTGAGVQPVYHPADDTAYFFDDNVVYSLSGSTWTASVLTLPADQKITCACAHGTYLAIGTITKGTLNVKSTVYLWDRDSSLTTLSDKIDFGEGTLFLIGSLNNKLIGLVSFYVNNLYALGKGEILVKQQSGEFATILERITTDTTSSINPLSQNPTVRDNKMYFTCSAPLLGDARLGIWCVDENGKVALDTSEPLATSYQGIYPIAATWWIACSGDGTVTHTDGTGTYSTTTPSVWETLILSTVSVTSRGTIIMDAMTTKKLVSVTSQFAPLTSGQSVKLYYRTDGASAWTLIFTFITVGQVSHTAINIESSGGNFVNYNEIQFRTESYGGAVVTGLKYAGEVIPNDLNN